ncbi:citrate transporter [Corynebacterium sp. sy017]|uniref:CitMHS family transporter n=1 Tax=unclassified Corynebacterium TaxID=2624378 RepID=UPI001185FDB5|nr:MULTISPECIES: citrate:proton symporter [unclassified Corynebacterium]MBP3089295.1 citrate transporter [Corynebacterium sp. sy017]QDZ43233.1 citrate transporter [Corynebacterium sp. sy039]TSD91118.1 citrate transporter [Corynebacterium sp. SY003]
MQTPLALTIIGLCIIISTVAILMRGKVHPIVAMSLIPTLGALVAGFGFSGVTEFFSAGLESVINVSVMFIFAIIYFGIMSDVGLFTPLVKTLIIATRGNVILVALGTAAIAIVAHLDGAGATTFLITLPALLPLYHALHMSRYVLLAIVSLAAAVMNMMPWAGPLGRASSVISQDPIDLWQHILPVQLMSIVVVFIIAFFLGLRESKRIAVLRRSPEFVGRAAVDVHDLARSFEQTQKEEQEKENVSYRRSKGVFAANVILSLLLLGVLMSGILPPAAAFMIATAVALLINFSDSAQQAQTLTRHAPSALSMAGVILAAAMFLGVLKESGMLEHIALSLLAVLPTSFGPWIHVAVGLLGVPLDLLTSTDAYYFSLLPVVQETVSGFGISGTGAASALILGNIIGTFVSPFSPALWLAIGLSKTNIGRHIKFTFPIAWAFGIAVVLIAHVMGLLA